MIEQKKYCKGCHWSRDKSLFEGFRQCKVCRERKRKNAQDKRHDDIVIEGKQFCKNCCKHKDIELFGGFKQCTT